MKKNIYLILSSAVFFIAMVYLTFRNDASGNISKNDPSLPLSSNDGHLKLTSPTGQDLPPAEFSPESPTESTKEFSRNMTGWFVQRSARPSEDAIKYPLFALADLSFIPPNKERWISSRRAPLTDCAFDQRVPLPIRRNLIGLLLSTADADPNGIMPKFERLKLEGERYNCIRDHDYADATRRLVKAIFKYKLNLSRVDCLDQLTQTKWHVDKEEVDYVFDELLPKIRVHQ